jgi:hypothetical protein
MTFHYVCGRSGPWGLLSPSVSDSVTPCWRSEDERVILNNGDHITREIKKIERGTLFFKPDCAFEDTRLTGLGLTGWKYLLELAHR